MDGVNSSPVQTVSPGAGRSCRSAAVADPAAVFERERSRLFAVAYRMLGSAAEAEDVVQDAYLRWQGADRGQVAAPGAWLVKTVVNLCLNVLDSARLRRERYVGPWLPEPVLTADGALGPLESVERRESVSFALLVLLERLTAAERAVFVLREAFGYPHARIAEVLELSEDNCRQLLRRARNRVGGPQARFDAPLEQRRRMVEEFLRAAADGDLAGLEELLAQDVVSWADGGGTVSAARRPVLGPSKVARLVAGLVVKSPPGLRVEIAEVNGEPALVALLRSKVLGVLVPEFSRQGIVGLRNVLNPRKLEFFGRQWAERTAA
ncbi:RNA polymerase sigma-70 factor [Streptantibioticus rubrisoli]|uniref:RNA polymerase sigma-70 factor n=1 Tax=Streptantibioticus rubrisoli TaxID=1387313 RepID=A0ABT1PKH7_9ACTN|nr:RNA polymerase sigma-70 factor [Streptantibioticus rubrisoli]MCQ4045033.1 RNA polymerase sigma-70 factor [Streptantibioticus rubrisoli]